MEQDLTSSEINEIQETKSKRIIKPIITHRNNKTLSAANVKSHMKKKRQTRRFLVRGPYENHHTFSRSALKVLKSPKATEKLTIQSPVKGNSLQIGERYLSESIKGLRSLKHIWINFGAHYLAGGTQLQMLAKSLKNLTSLESLGLFLSWSKINASGEKKLCLALRSLTSLKIIEMNLASFKNIQKIANVLKSLVSLEEITLRLHLDNNVAQKDLQCLTKTFRTLPSLKNLNFMLPDMCDTAAKELSNGLTGLSELKSFRFDADYSNLIADEEFQSLAQSLESLVSLQELFVFLQTSKQITNDGLQSLGQSLHKLKNLKCIKLNIQSWDRIDRVGLARLWQDLSSLSQLESIDFKFHDNVGPNVMKSVAQVFDKFTSLKALYLDFHKCHVIESTLEELQKGLKNLPLLEDIKLNFLSCRQVNDFGAKQLGQAFKTMTNLRNIWVNLGGCGNITDAGLLAVTCNFNILTSLKDVTLGFTGFRFSDSAMKELGRFIKSLACLQVILVHFTEISEVGLESIWKGLKALSCLQSINIHALVFHTAEEKIEAIKQDLASLPSFPIVNFECL